MISLYNTIGVIDEASFADAYLDKIDIRQMSPSPLCVCMCLWVLLTIIRFYDLKCDLYTIGIDFVERLKICYKCLKHFRVELN